MSDLDTFGSLTATWAHYDTADEIVLSNVPNTCAKLKDYQLADWGRRKFSANHDSTGADYCSQAKDVTFAWAEAYEALYHEGARHLILSVDDDGRSEPDEDTYRVDGAPGLAGTLWYFGHSPMQDILEQWDVDAGASDGDLCGVDIDESYEYWLLADGALEFTVVGTANATGTLEATLETGSSREEAGTVDAKFTAHYCEIVEDR